MLWPFLALVVAAAVWQGREVVRLSEHFTLRELTRTSTGLPNDPPPQALLNLRNLCLQTLEPLRAEVGALRITSGYRSERVNGAVGGAEGSQHTQGTAADCKPLTGSSEAAMVALYELDQAGRVVIDQAILYAPERGGHLHVSWAAAPRSEFLYAPASGGYAPWRG